MCAPKAPTPPDPKQTAAAQTGTNISTAIAESVLNRTNQVTPYGSLNYDQTGTYSYTDPTTGQSYDLPQYTATQTLSPEQQGIFDASTSAQTNLAQTADERSGFLKDYLAKPFSLNNDAVEGRLFELGSKRLDPKFAQQQQELEQNLANRGIKMGSEAYDRSLGNFQEGKNDAFNQLLISGRGQAVNELLTERNQPINEIAALLSQTGVQQPGFVNTPQAQLPTTDYAGLVNSNYNAQMQQYMQQMQGRNQLVGGLFGLGAGALTGGYV